MLQFLRSTAGSWVVKILFVLLIASFAVWGIGDIFRGRGPDTTVAEVGSFAISAEDVDREFRTQLNRLRPVLGNDFDLEQARALGLLDQALNQLIQRALFQLAARDAGLQVGEAMVRQRIQAQPSFRDESGRFDPELFRRFLSANGLTEPAFLQSLREEAAQELLAGAVASGTHAPKPLVEALYRHREEKRVAETLFVAEDAAAAVGTPDDATLQTTYEDRIVQFTAPEYRALSAVVLRTADVAAGIEVAEAELIERFEQDAESFATPERRTVKQVVLPSEAAALALLERVRAGTTLEDAAQAAGVFAPVTFEAVTEEELPDLGATAFALAPGEAGGPVQTPFGWHVLAVTGVTPAVEPSFATARDQVLEEVRTEKALDRLYQLSNKLDDILAGGGTLESAAAELGVPLVKVAAVDAEGRNPAGEAIGDVPYLGAMIDRAASLRAGDASIVAETEDGNFFVVRVDAITPARQRPLDEVRDQVVAVWEAEQRREQAAARAKALAEKLRTGAPLEEVAAEGAAAAVPPAMSRTGAPTGRITAALQQQLFAMEPGQVTQGGVQGGQLVVRLKKVVPADPAAADETALASQEATVAQGIAADILAQYVEALKREHTVTINQQTLEAMF